MPSLFGKSLAAGTSAALGLLVASSAWAQVSIAEPDEQRDFDARVEYNRGVALQMSEPQAAALEAMRGAIPDFTMTWDRTMGTVTSLSSHTGYLSGPAAQGTEPLAAALDFVSAQLPALGLSPQDVSSYRVTDSVFSRVSGATHIYAEQMYQGIPVYGAALHVNVNREGRIISVNNSFVPQLEAAVNAGQPALGAAQAMLAAMGNVGVALAEAPQPLGPAQGVQQRTRFSGEGISSEPMEARLVYLPVRADEVRLVWNIGTMWTADSQHTYEFNVDAQTGQVWTRFDTTSSASYRVYDRPVTGPDVSRPMAPADGRTLVVNPENRTASPMGWLAGESLMSTANNNIRACTDRNADNRCDTDVPQPVCRNGSCDFPINLNADPLSVDPFASVTNLFYLTNLFHDVQYQYGFDEAAGNFQVNNFGRGGVGNDAVFAQGQDGSGKCNANFSTPSDGTAGRLQMFLCDRAMPRRDGDLDTTVVLHEYGHGVSTRQVGGPNRTQASCLRGEQQAGEGWSDWFGLVFTTQAGDTGPKVRGRGTFLYNRTPVTGTIRDLPYSTNNAVNPWTYESIQTAGIPHGVGSRWTEAIWEVYWALIDKHGFEADLVNFDIRDGNEAGNKRALFYINEGFKNTACPQTGLTFLDNRNGIMQAAADNFGGEDVCTIWQAFAGFGLGVDASTADSSKISARNGFAVPRSCRNAR
jgi:extracellular elastinolytic metalloproteinase